MHCDVFGRWVHRRKSRQIVQVAVVHRPNYFIDQTLQLMKIHHHTYRIELIGHHSNTDAPVVAMDRLERAIIKPQRMSGGELAGDGDLKGHSYVNCTNVFGAMELIVVNRAGMRGTKSSSFCARLGNMITATG